MKITEAINRLTVYLRDHGDIEFVVLTEVDGRFCIEQDRPVDLIEININGDKEELVAAVMPDDSMEDRPKGLRSV